MTEVSIEMELTFEIEAGAVTHCHIEGKALDEIIPILPMKTRIFLLSVAQKIEAFERDKGPL